jgi:putative transposase
MTTVAPNRSGFTDVLDSFLNQAGLPFADAFSADDIRQAFDQRNGLFATDAVFSTPVVLWAFLAQVLRDGKQAACNAAVEDIANYQRQAGGPIPSGDTGDYCRARAKLDWRVLRDMIRYIASRLEASAPEDWLWQGRSTKLIDGFTFSMPDTPDNQEAFPQQKTQAEGVGQPIARACVVLSLATGAIYDVAYGPYAGKEPANRLFCVRSRDAWSPAMWPCSTAITGRS